MWILNKKGAESPAEGEPLTESHPSLWGPVGDVYRFILWAVNGDRATAHRMFEDFLDGKLSQEIMSISRDCVSADQAGSSKLLQH
jgi:hypothetical protein